MAKKRRFKKRQPGISLHKYEALRDSYDANRNIAQAARDAGVNSATATRYITEGESHHYGGGMSIEDWCIAQDSLRHRQKSERAANREEVYENTMDGVLVDTASALQNMRVKPDGVKQPDGTILVDAQEQGRMITNFTKAMDGINKNTGMTPNQIPRPNFSPEAHGVLPNYPDAIPVDGVPTEPPVVFQGAIERGIIFKVPDHPKTIFDKAIAVQAKYAEAFSLEGDKDHGHKIKTTIKRAFEIKKRKLEDDQRS